MRKMTLPLLFLFAVCVLAVSVRILWSAGAKVQLSIQTNSPRAFHKELYGFNTNMLPGIYAYSDKRIVDVTAALSPAVLRFPGGTVANYYHWNKAGFIKSELDASPAKWLSNQYKNLQRLRNGVLSFDDFMALCTKLNIKPLLVVNLYTGSPEESAEWVRYVKVKGYKVFGWELGNELTIPSYRNRIRDIDDYISVARRHLDAMRAVDPGIRVAVLARPFLDPEGPRLERGKGWNDRLRGQTFFDAVTVHPYLQLDKLMGNVSSMDPEKLKARIFEAGDALLKGVSDYARLFSGKELWVTEWNITFRDNKETADTLLHALYCGDFFINMAKIDGITNADYHTLSGPWNGFPVFSPKDHDPENSVKRACYYSFQIIREAVSRSDKRFQLTVDNSPVLSGSSRYTSGAVSGLSAVSLGQTNKVLILVTNRTSSDVPYNLALDGKQVTGNVRYRFLTAKSLGSTGKDDQIEIRETTYKADNLVLPANSFGLIELL